MSVGEDFNDLKDVNKNDLKTTWELHKTLDTRKLSKTRVYHRFCYEKCARYKIEKIILIIEGNVYGKCLF